MAPSPSNYGFWIRGGLWERRLLVEHDAAFRGYASLSPNIDPDGESYLSAFTYGPSFRDYLETTGSTRDYVDTCAAPVVWWDIDRASDLESALDDARRLASTILERANSLDESDLLLFYSGSKGFHVGLPTFWSPDPSANFHRAAKRFAGALADEAGVRIDAAIYDKVRPFRCPNSRHPKTGCFKRRFSFEELVYLSLDAIIRLAGAPEPFDPPEPRPSAVDIALMRGRWADAEGGDKAAREAIAVRRSALSPLGAGRLNRGTMDFIREGAAADRAVSLFSAAANLSEFGCPSSLAFALLEEAALDSGLPPKEVRRQIECGLNHLKTEIP